MCYAKSGKAKLDQDRQVTAAGKPIAQLKINLFAGGVCEMLIGGDEVALRAAIVKNLGKIAASLRT